MFYMILLAGLGCFFLMAAKAWQKGDEGKFQESLEAAKAILQERQDKLLELQYSTSAAAAANKALNASIAAAEDKQRAFLEMKDHWKQRVAFIQNQHLTEFHTLALLQQGNDLTEETFNELREPSISEQQFPNQEDNVNQQLLFQQQQIHDEQVSFQLQMEGYQEQQAFDRQMLDDQQRSFEDHRSLNEDGQHPTGEVVTGPDMIWDEMDKSHVNGMGFHPFDEEHARLVDSSLEMEDTEYNADWNNSYGDDSDSQTDWDSGYEDASDDSTGWDSHHDDPDQF